MVKFACFGSAEAQCTVAPAWLNHDYIIPDQGLEMEIIPVSKYADLGPDCTFTYDLAGPSTTDLLTINPTFGFITFVNSAAAEAALSFSVVVTGTNVTNGVSNDITVGPLQISAKCGDGSTRVTFEGEDFLKMECKDLGGNDRVGRSCNWYYGRTEYCGNYDTDNFQSR